MGKKITSIFVKWLYFMDVGYYKWLPWILPIVILIAIANIAVMWK